MKTVVIGADDTQTLTFTNTRMGSLVVKKIDSVTKSPLEGVKFEVKGYEDYGYPSGTYTTDENGEFRIDEIPSGSYTITETEALPGYKLDNTAKTVEVTGGETKEVTFTNDPLGGLLIKKMDSETKEPLSDVTFKVTLPSGAVVGESNGEYTTDESGYISIPDLEPGTYIVEEVKAKSGYLLDSTPKTIVIKDNETYTLEFYNQPKGTLIVRKVDSVTKEPLEGVEFEIKTTDGTLVAADEGLTSSNGRYVTDENGEIVLDNLMPGSYVVTETKTIDGYAMDAAPQTVVINAGDTQTLNFTNTPLGGLLVKVMSGITMEPLADVILKVTDSNGVAVGGGNGEYHTDEYGYISIPDLAPGTYIVTEVQAKSGYLLDDTPKTIVIKDYQTYTLEIFNQPKGGLVIRKIDSKSKEPLEGVQFKITTSTGELVMTNEGLTSSNGIYTTDANGEITLSKLTPGTYVVTESKTIDGYMMDAAPQTVVVSEGDTQTLTFTNTPGASLTVKSIDSTTNEPLSGVKFEVKGYDDVDYPTGSYVTNTNGLFRVDGIPTGTYTVVQTQAKDGYLLNSSPQTVQINAGESKELTFASDPLSGMTITLRDSSTNEALAGVVVKITTLDGTVVGTSNGEFTADENGNIYVSGLTPGSYIIQQVSSPSGYVIDSTPKTIQITDSQTYTVSITNQRKGGLLVRMVDSTTKEPLEGVEFKITTASGEFVSDNEGLTSSNGLYVTDSNGEISLSKLSPGTYIVTQTTTIDGYILDSTSQTVVVNNNDTQILTFTNSRQGGLVIRKIDEDSRQPLKNAIFSIKKVSGEVISADAETDANGLITLNDLDPGTYIIAEEQAPEGYVLQEAPMTVDVKKNTPVEVTFTNRAAYGIQIRAIIATTHDPLANCKFEVKKANGEFIGTFVSDSSGFVNVPELPDGIYVVQEVNCPEGYTMSKEPQNVIVKSGTLSTVTFEHDPLSGIRIKKIDAVTGDGIYGVRFTVKDANNRLIGEYTTDQDGYINLDNLATQSSETVTYKVQEIAAASGYVLDKTVRSLKVAPGETTELVVENTPILGQIQIEKKSAQDNIVTNELKGTLLEGAVFEITNADTGRVVDTVTTNASGIAASNPIPLGRYYVQEIQAPRFYQINSQIVEVKLKLEGDVVCIEFYDDAANLKTSIQKTGNSTVNAGYSFRYDISNVANLSNVSLDNFFWHDRIPTDAVRVGSITTGTYNTRAWYKITYKTNKNDYRTLADNLMSTSNYSFNVDSKTLKLAADEYVTDIRYEFTSSVPSGFQMTTNATVYVYVPTTVSNGYEIINRADAGGSYQGEWDTSSASWSTIVSAPVVVQTTPTTPSITKLPQTGY